jgi:glucose/arabinose dehydrogenase
VCTSNISIGCLILFSSLSIVSTAYSDEARLPVSAATGPAPELPAPKKSLVPTVHVATATGWRQDATPEVAPGMQVNAFATGLSHPRWLYTLPNGDVLVAETDTPPKPDDAKGIKGKIYKATQKRAGSGQAPSANRITLLRDTNGDGSADVRATLIENLNSPFGMALVGMSLYVADTDAVLRFPYKQGETKISAEGTKLTDLPAGTLNHHWTKSLVANKDGAKLYVGVGSNSNVGENGTDAEKERAAVWEIDTATGQRRIFASGLRNPVGLAWEPERGDLWVAVNERDELGSDVPPDYMTALRPGAFYGWPYSYYGQHVDDRVKPQRPDLVAQAVEPDYALGPHTASLGLCATGGNNLPSQFQHGMFVGQHGSWNREPFSGYKVLFVPFENGHPQGQPVDVLTGFINDKGEARGRPVGVAIDKQGDLLVADDVGDTVWRVTGASRMSKR